MSDTPFFDVFNPTSVAYALGAGLTFGASVLTFLTLHFPPRAHISTRAYAVMAATVSSTSGALFFAGQIVQADASGDPAWERPLARGVLWQLFAVGIGGGLGFARSFAQDREATEAEGTADKESRQP